MHQSTILVHTVSINGFPATYTSYLDDTMDLAWLGSTCHERPPGMAWHGRLVRRCAAAVAGGISTVKGQHIHCRHVDCLDGQQIDLARHYPATSWFAPFVPLLMLRGVSRWETAQLPRHSCSKAYKPWPALALTNPGGAAQLVYCT